MNPEVPVLQISKHFKVKRSTIYGILHSKQVTLDFANTQPCGSLTFEASRVVESRFLLLEELLSLWYRVLRAHIPVPGKAICSQAFDIHCMLSGLLPEPLPPCLFSSGWLARFKRQRNISFRHKPNTDVTSRIAIYTTAHDILVRLLPPFIPRHMPLVGATDLIETVSLFHEIPFSCCHDHPDSRQNSKECTVIRGVSYNTRCT